jgi:hypothetical protein
MLVEPRSAFFPENVCSRFPPLLQSSSPQSVSAGVAATKKASFRAVLRDGLGVLHPERYANSLSKRRSLSGAWESADLLYKLFSLFDQGLHNLQQL